MTAGELGRRVAGAVLVVLLVSVLAALLVNLVPGDAASVIAGEAATEEQLAAIREQLGTDQPIYLQYLNWAGDVLSGDLGTSLITDRPVLDLLLVAAPPTLTVTALASLLAVVVGVGLGAVAGIRRGSTTDRVASLVSTLGIAMPSFWVGLILVSVFAFTFRLLPATGYVGLAGGVGPWLVHALLPATALGLATAAEIARQTRSGVSDVFDRPYIRTARAKGVPTGQLLRRHVARNAAIPVVTVLGLQIGRLLGGVIVIESVFGIPGLGTLAVSAVLSRDLPVIQGYILLITLVVVAINFAVDLTYRWIDPKVQA